MHVLLQMHYVMTHLLFGFDLRATHSNKSPPVLGGVMIFQSLKTFPFAFFALTVGVAPAACADCASIEGEHFENAHDEKAGAAICVPIWKVIAPTLDHHKDASRESCEDDCEQCASTFVRAMPASESFSIELPRWGEKTMVKDAVDSVRRAALVMKPFAARRWGALPGVTFTDLNIRLLI